MICDSFSLLCLPQLIYNCNCVFKSISIKQPVRVTKWRWFSHHFEHAVCGGEKVKAWKMPHQKPMNARFTIQLQHTNYYILIYSFCEYHVVRLIGRISYKNVNSEANQPEIACSCSKHEHLRITCPRLLSKWYNFHKFNWLLSLILERRRAPIQANALFNCCIIAFIKSFE